MEEKVAVLYAPLPEEGVQFFFIEIETLKVTGVKFI